MGRLIFIAFLLIAVSCNTSEQDDKINDLESRIKSLESSNAELQRRVESHYEALELSLEAFAILDSIDDENIKAINRIACNQIKTMKLLVDLYQ
jgi:hypothetical protein